MKRLLIILAGVCLLHTSCKEPDYKTVLHNPILFTEAVHKLNDVVMGNNFSAVVSSRNYAYANIAAYEVIAAGYPQQYQSLSGQLNGLKTVAKPAHQQGLDFEYAALLAFCKVGEAVTFPEGSMQYFVDSLNTMADRHGMPRETQKNSVAYANAVAQSILAWSKGDNYSKTQSASKYTILNLPGTWIPTPPMYAQASEPHWSTVRPLVMDSASQFRVPPPPKFDITDTNSFYFKELMAIKNAVENLTDEQKHMAEFWDDNPFKLNISGHAMFATKKFSPPGHWMSIAGIAAEKTNADFGTTVYAYTKTAIALFDSFIQSWDAKYFYNTARPETVINKHLDADWRPFLQTPAFPEYTCGHSTASSAAAEALTSVFGDNLTYTDTSEEALGIPSRTFESFRAAALENNWARFYGGLHFHNSCLVAHEFGKKVGNLVVNRLVMKK